jgi:hypothetical protein
MAHKLNNLLMLLSTLAKKGLTLSARQKYSNQNISRQIISVFGGLKNFRIGSVRWKVSLVQVGKPIRN